MRILVIGGSVFLGRAIVDAAIRHGHRVTTFNRGRTGTDLPGVEVIRGDRESADDLAILGNRYWDTVIDVCGFVPHVVADSARILSGHAETYVFISSVSAYADWPAMPVDETSARFPCAPDAGLADAAYGPLKAGCERVIESTFDGRVVIVNPGLIVGPHENVGRLPWWLERISRGGRVLAPGKPDRALQLIDARDIAEFVLTLSNARESGRFITSGVPENATFASLLNDCCEATGSDAELVWADDGFLLDQGVEPWTELPLWTPLTPEFTGIWDASSAKAIAAGLQCRPVQQTVHDTWRWLLSRGTSADLPRYRHTPDHGMDPGRERELLAAWDSR